jgi:hypothetical protein
MTMGLSEVLELDDIGDAFDFVEEALDYHDGPLSGWLREKGTGELFAFDCQPVILDLLWHWTVVRAAPGVSAGDDPSVTLERAATSGDGSWLSVTEDRRDPGSSGCRLVRIDNARARPVLFSSRCR